MIKRISKVSNDKLCGEITVLLHVEMNNSFRTYRVIRIDTNEVEIEGHGNTGRFFIQGNVCGNVTISVDDLFLNDLSFIVDARGDASQEGSVIVLKSATPHTSHILWNIINHDISGKGIGENESVRAIHVPCRNEYTEEARQKRLDFIENRIGIKLPHISSTSISAERVKGNIEAFIGAIEIPVAIAGPLKINGKNAKGIFFAPMATTEGALISSVTRGSMALTRSGGVTTHAIWQRVTRAPVFNLETVNDALFLSDWISNNRPTIQVIISNYSRHAEIIDIDARAIGNNLHVKFIYETGDASGQNMTTKCTWEASQWILSTFERDYPGFIRGFIIDGNMSTDKKVSYSSFINGRGIKVTAEAWIDEKILRNVLKVSKEKILKSYHDIALGANQCGMIGMNINISNVIAAIFTATGQDIACVHESSLGQLFIEPVKSGIYCSMTLTNLMIGTIGGGTGLDHQKEALDIIGCYGVGKVQKFAEIIASYCLALDMSTLAAVSGGQFVYAHESLGRNRPEHTPSVQTA